MVQVTIADITFVQPEESKELPLERYVVTLYDEAGRRVLPIWVGPAEGEAIAIGLTDFAFPRPLTHRFLSSLLQGINAGVEEVSVVGLKQGTFYGMVKIRNGKKTCEIDARPSDAIALAVLNNVPIFVAEEVFENTGIAVPASVKGAPNRKGLEKITRVIEDRVRKNQAFMNRHSKQPAELSKGDISKRDTFIASMFGK